MGPSPLRARKRRQVAFTIFAGRAIQVARSIGIEWDFFQRPIAATARALVGELVHVTKREVVVGQRLIDVRPAWALPGAEARGRRDHQSYEGKKDAQGNRSPPWRSPR